MKIDWLSEGLNSLVVLQETRIKVAESVGRIQGQVEAQVDELRNNVRDNVSEVAMCKLVPPNLNVSSDIGQHRILDG